MLLKRTTRDGLGLNARELLRTHRDLYRLQVLVDGAHHLAVALEASAHTVDAREDLLGDELGEVSLTILTGNPLRQEAYLLSLGICGHVGENRTLIDLNLLGSHLDDSAGDRCGGHLLGKCEQVTPAAILRYQSQHVIREGGHLVSHPLPHNLCGGTLTLPAAHIAVLEEHDPEVQEGLVVGLSLMPNAVELSVDSVLVDATDEKSIEGYTRVTHPVRGVDIAALDADCSVGSQIVEAHLETD